MNPETRKQVEEELSRQIHGVYCRYRKEVHGEEYWTKGNYDLLDEKTKEADRYMARFFLTLASRPDEMKGEEMRDRLDWATQILEALQDDSPCEFDHHGYCQAHGWLNEDRCPQDALKEFLASRTLREKG